MPRHCQICAVPTDGLWMDRPLCDQCLGEMADELGHEVVAPPTVALDYITRAREALEETGSDRREEGWRQW